MKKIFAVLSFIILLFSSAIEIETSIKHRDYVNSFAGFCINKPFEKTIHHLECTTSDVYKIEFREEEDFDEFVRLLKSTDFVLHCNLKELKNKPFFSNLNGLIYGEDFLSEISPDASDSIDVYTRYRSYDFKLNADLLILVPKTNLCYLFINYN